MHELGFGRKAATVPLADGEPGHELQVDTGQVLSLGPTRPACGARRRLHREHLRFVYPIERETTEKAIAAAPSINA